MVKFGETLVVSQQPEWHNFYLNYDKLKGILKKTVKSRTKIPKRASFSRLDIDLSQTKKIPEALLLELEFRRTVDQEIEKVVLFMLELQGKIAKELADLSFKREECIETVAKLLTDFHSGDGALSNAPDAAYSILRSTHQGYLDVANMVLSLTSYAELNITALRKILKKHDKHHPEHKCSQIYLTDFEEEVDSHLNQLFNEEGICALVATLNNAFMELHQVELKLVMIQENTRSHMRRAKSAPSFLLKGGWEMDADPLAAATQPKDDKLSMKETLLIEYSKNTPLELDDSPDETYFTVVTQLHEPILDDIYVQRSQLKKSTVYQELAAAKSLMFDTGIEEEPAIVKAAEMEGKSSRAQISAFLNLSSTFLYMANYNIVAPTTGQYALRLGSSEALAGIIIGMTANAALVATVLYCWWSNFSYKNAMLFAAVCCLLGNICYALALQYNSITMVMVGRFLNGFGSARSINRRFIADTFTRAERTAASAAFVTAGTLGMATGPAIASILGHLEYDPDNLLWSEETAPGWVMMTLWIGFIALSVIYFEEPTRAYLTEVPKSVEGLETANGEKQPLLANTAAVSESVPPKKPKPLYRNIPVMVTLWIYFVLKLVSECTGSSCATLTSYYFGWDARHSGAFLAFLGLLLFPVNIVVAALSRRYEDRELIMAMLSIMFVSIAGIISYWPGHYSVYQYVFFGVCVYVSSSILEGPNMSLLSKTMPKEWARGTFNSGFMATEAGTAARSVGDIVFALAAAFGGADSLLNSTFLYLLAFVFVAVVLTRQTFDYLTEDDEDDDSSALRGSKTSTSKKSIQST